ncbi:putative O-antigen polymerase [Bradyrhizobium sp. ORS 375]|uniref:O-antigen ligase family protein n=1 Tax=Bradyrhizobium sp. (strain ORS 375) TaxID=566679 RepID=UPI0002409656|nr:O-antigen ligase family protein [Bradyrhizobium sp. ORS 375]CCD92772.1 putative O-antigen polymerase [Bradyrhizobium sp. ORS 375]
MSAAADKLTRMRSNEAASAAVGVNRIACWLLAGIAALAPFPYAGTDPTTLAVLAGMIGLAVAFCRPTLRDRGNGLLIALGLLIIALYAVVLHEQLSLHPWLGLSPDPAWRQALQLLGSEPAAPLSLVRDQPVFALGAPLACLGVLACAVVVASSPTHAELLLKAVAWSGLAYALYGLAAYLVDPSVVLLRDKVLDRNVLNATFPNRNTAALYFGCCAVLWELLLLRRLSARGALEAGWRSLRAVTWDRKLVLAAAATLICLTCVMLTGSRAGLVISLAGGLGAASLVLRRQFASWRGVLWGLAPAVVIILAALAVLGGQVTERIGAHGLEGGGRLETYAATWRMIQDHPLVGAGLGSFRYVFPRYRDVDASIWGIWDRAHSTPLELAAEMGLPLAVVVCVAWGVVLVLLARGAVTRRTGGIFPIAGLICGGMAVLHSLVDFSLQIPGFAIPVLTLMGVGLAQRHRSGGRRAP